MIPCFYIRCASLFLCVCVCVCLRYVCLFVFLRFVCLRVLILLHSLRRLANTVARRHREAMQVSEAEIDVYFGWHERVLLKEMQVHYEAMSPLERMLHAKITGMM